MKRAFHFPLKPFVAAVGLACAANAAWAVEPFVIKDIKVEGLQRVDAGTVFASIPVKVGDTYNDDHGAAAIRSLFNLGVFQDVRIDVRSNEMVIVVQERPTINAVEVNPGKQFNKATLLAGLSRMGIASGRSYDKAVETRAIQELLRQYEEKGFFGVEIIPTVTPIDRNRVNLLFTVREGYRSRIKDIRFVGNHAFSNSTLEDEMQLDTGNWMSWYTRSDVYSENKLNTDLDALRNFYHNRGYMEFRVDSVQTAISPDKRTMGVVINVTEGPRYVISGVSMQGNYLGKNDEFQSLIKIKPGEPYKQADIAETLEAMRKRFGAYGHAFAKIDVRPQIDQEKQQVELTLVADPGNMAYIRKINVVGNTKTRDEVIRRELRQYEASWYNADKIQLSRERLERLGYFTDINIETKPVSDSPDQADLEVTVKERPTGSIQLGAGYSTTDKIVLTLSLSQENIFGSGQTFAADVSTGKYDRTYSIRSIDPYFTTSGISRTFYASHSQSQPRPGVGGDYRIRSETAGVSFGVPFSENDTINFGLGLERYGIKVGSSAIPNSYQEYIKRYGTSAVGVPLSIGWSRDTRDSALAPSSGSLHSINGSASFAGKMRYAMATYKFQQYFPITKNVSLMFNVDAGIGKGINCKKNTGSSANCFPFYKNFFAGGIGSVRGFEYGGIGPQETNPASGTTYSVGGRKMFNTNLELIAPFPGTGNDKTLRLFAFLDAGNVYADSSATYQPTSADKKIRVSAGVGLRWISPIGPLSLSFGYPIRKQPSDRLQKFQFQLGTSF